MGHVDFRPGGVDGGLGCAGDVGHEGGVYVQQPDDPLGGVPVAALQLKLWRTV